MAHDRFTFSIKLADTANLESKTLFFCIRYSVNGQEYWDNNGSANFQVDFRKKHLPQNGKNNFQGAASKPLNGLPRSNRRQGAGSALRPKSYPLASDEFGNEAKFNFDQPIHEVLGESGPTSLRLKTRPAGNLASDNITKSLSSPSGLAFANRYDFGASLSAAVQAAKDSMGKDKDTLYMRGNSRDAAPVPAVAALQGDSPVFGTSQSGSGTGSPNPSLPSSSYEELVNKYCFFGSKQSSPTMHLGDVLDGRFDGSKGADQPGSGNTVTLAASPPSMLYTGVAARHAIHLRDSNPYFQQVIAMGASPAESPLGSDGSQASTPSAFMPLTGTPPNEVQYEAQQHVLPERFPWGRDAHAATAIRG